MNALYATIISYILSQNMTNATTMRIIWKPLLLLLVSATSCTKEGRLERQTRKDITGHWELSIYACGLCGPSRTYEQGNGNIIEFGKGGEYLRRVKDSAIFQGRYEIVSSKECNKDGDVALKTNQSTSGTAMFIKLENDTLQLSTPTCYADGAVSIYRRIK